MIQTTAILVNKMSRKIYPNLPRSLMQETTRSHLKVAEYWKQLTDGIIEFELDEAIQQIMSEIGNDNNALVVMNIVKKFACFTWCFK